MRIPSKSHPINITKITVKEFIQKETDPDI